MMTETEQIVVKYAQIIKNIAASRVNPSDVEDVIQDVLLKYCEKTPKFENEGHAKGWFITVTLNLTHDRYRAKEFTQRGNYSVTLRNPQFLHKVEKWEGSEKNQRNVNIQEEKKVVC